MVSIVKSMYVHFLNENALWFLNLCYTGAYNLPPLALKLSFCRVISLACVSSETHNLQCVFLSGGRGVPFIGYIAGLKIKKNSPSQFASNS